ncbi:unnamed protein product, partial [Strongylus vulgaris]
MVEPKKASSETFLQVVRNWFRARTRRELIAMGFGAVLATFTTVVIVRRYREILRQYLFVVDRLGKVSFIFIMAEPKKASSETFLQVVRNWFRARTRRELIAMGIGAVLATFTTAVIVRRYRESEPKAPADLMKPPPPAA